jgi:hypothetical protein
MLTGLAMMPPAVHLSPADEEQLARVQEQPTHQVQLLAVLTSTSRSSAPVVMKRCTMDSQSSAARSALGDVASLRGSSTARASPGQYHIGSGASWFVKAKICGCVAVMFDPATRSRSRRRCTTCVRRDTCEQCHWPRSSPATAWSSAVTTGASTMFNGAGAEDRRWRADGKAMSVTGVHKDNEVPPRDR